jgi:uncharacterized protein (UPF0147 family)
VHKKDAIKILDEIGYDPEKGTRKLNPESRKKAKGALNALAKLGESYEKKAAKAVKPKTLESEGSDA